MEAGQEVHTDLSKSEDRTDLGNGEEAPDGGLLLKVGSNPGGEVGTESPEEDTLNNHVALHDEKGGEHQERVDGSGGREVRDVVHGDTSGVSELMNKVLGLRRPLGRTSRRDGTCPCRCKAAHRGATRW